MNVAIQVPIKRSSERIPSKNFLPLNGKPLWEHLINELSSNLPDRYEIFIDTDCPDEIDAPDRVFVLERPKYLSEEWSNGNHLLASFVQRMEDRSFDLYIQAFVTAPFLKAGTIEKAVAALLDNAGRDSLVPGTKQGIFFWKDGHPSYVLGAPSGFGRLQDSPVFIESTGFYIIRREALLKHGTRTGLSPMLFEIPRQEAIDIDTPWDFSLAETLLRH